MNIPPRSPEGKVSFTISLVVGLGKPSLVVRLIPVRCFLIGPVRVLLVVFVIKSVLIIRILVVLIIFLVILLLIIILFQRLLLRFVTELTNRILFLQSIIDGQLLSWVVCLFSNPIVFFNHSTGKFMKTSSFGRLQSLLVSDDVLRFDLNC
jgi:hypothetical protein